MKSYNFMSMLYTPYEVAFVVTPNCFLLCNQSLQEPAMFTGSLRFNLDPLEEYTDVEIWNALEKVGNSGAKRLNGSFIHSN